MSGNRRWRAPRAASLWCASLPAWQFATALVTAMARPHAVEQDDGADAAAETPSADAYVPAVTAAAVSSCAYSSWAPLFSRHAHRAECVDLPQVRRTQSTCAELG